MTAIDIDFDVFKALTNRRGNEAVTYNDVLRELLGLPAGHTKAPEKPRGWTWKGVTLPNGTDLRAEHKGTAYSAKIENGQWMQDGHSRPSPSAAAYAITEYGVNGWVFWSVRRPGDTTWTPLSKLRKS